ncbi:hypothetical protein BASA81_003929 [Batrachochytrium salamandrivorans]|nr:hypothetical protein BASA81_003929 [Batrachochytrium salamandrivorans]
MLSSSPTFQREQTLPMEEKEEGRGEVVTKRPKLMRQHTLGDEEEEVDSVGPPKLLRQLTMGEDELKSDTERASALLSLRARAEEAGFNVRSVLPFSATMFVSTPRPESVVDCEAATGEEERGPLAASLRLERVESWQEDVTDSSWRAW